MTPTLKPGARCRRGPAPKWLIQVWRSAEPDPVKWSIEIMRAILAGSRVRELAVESRNRREAAILESKEHGRGGRQQTVGRIGTGVGCSRGKPRESGTATQPASTL
jgi:hypothetical protein